MDQIINLGMGAFLSRLNRTRCCLFDVYTDGSFYVLWYDLIRIPERVVRAHSYINLQHILWSDVCFQSYQMRNRIRLRKFYSDGNNTKVFILVWKGVCMGKTVGVNRRREEETEYKE